MSKGCDCCHEGNGEWKVTFAHRLGSIIPFYLCANCYDTIRTAMEELKLDN